jgi:diguanylate cyclase (GGDEF)-like protein
MHENEPLTLFYMDLDNFKPINDTFGHKYGDSVLVAASEQIKKAFPDGMVARMGGDEFVIVLCGQYDSSDMHKRAAKLMADIESTFCDNKTFGKITISIGIAQTDGTDKDIDALIAESDAQMYKKKGTHLHIRK